jgi:hypothetical protein
MATKKTTKRAKYYVVNMGIARSGKLAVNSEHSDFASAARAAARDFKEFTDFGFAYLLPVLIVQAPSKSVASLPLAAEGGTWSPGNWLNPEGGEGTGRRFVGIYDVVKGKIVATQIASGSFADLQHVMTHGMPAARSGSPKRAGTPKRASKPKSGAPKRSPKQLSFPKKLGFARGSSR